MVPDERPLPPRHNRRTPDGEDLWVLTCNACRAASPIVYANIVRLVERGDATRADLELRRRRSSTRTAAWVTSRAVNLLSYLVAAVLVFTWLRFSYTGRASRIGYVQGMHARRVGAGSPWDSPHWITSDMSRAEIEAIIARINGERARSGH